MKITGYVLACTLAAVLSLQVLSAQQFSDRKDVRRGNRDFKKENYKEAEIDYRKALVKDSTSFAANYNLGNALYKMNDFQQAGKAYDALKSSAAGNPGASDLFYNIGNVAVQSKDWQSAVDAYKQALLRNPSDLDAKENYIYARKMLENQQNRQNQDKNNQNDKENQDNKDNKDNQNNQNDQNKDQQDNKENQDRNNDKGQDKQESKPQQSESKITPQAAQQMLQAIQAKEKETQEKVKKEKAQALKSRQKEKNW